MIADSAYSKIKHFPINIIDQINEELLITAATLKTNYPISYADSFAAALSKIKKSTLLSGDHEFKKLEDQKIIKIEWLT